MLKWVGRGVILALTYMAKLVWYLALGTWRIFFWFSVGFVTGFLLLPLQKQGHHE